MEPLRVLHLSTDDVTGGAARCAYRLHRGLRELGHDSRMLVARRRSDDPSVVRYAPERDLRRSLGQRVRRWRIERDHGRYRETRPDWPEPFSDDRAPAGAERSPELGRCDVVQLHWIAGLVDYRAFFRSVPRRAPVVWTLHDMNAFTGGCHYDDGCGRFADWCGACPQLGSRTEADLSSEVWRRKRDLFAGLAPERLQIVTPSRWLAGEGARSSVLGGRFPVTVIPYGLDTADFAPRDRSAAREALGIPESANVVLFVAHSVKIRRKGFSVLLEALRNLADVPDLFLLSVGKNVPQLGMPVAHRHVEYTGDDRLLSLIYSAADVFVLPSIQDNLPATVLEALACGLPVVGFRTGGVPEMVRPGITGSLAPRGDVRALSAAVAAMLADREGRARLAFNCRRIAVEEYDLKVQAQRYVELYEQLLGWRRPRVGAAEARSPVAPAVH